MMADTSLYAAPREITDPAQCSFYHTMDIPGVGRVEGEFDLRGRERKYLGGVDLRGKQVLEIGPANGHLTFFMEREGADVVSVELGEDQDWDVVPFARLDVTGIAAERRAGLRRLSNGYWLCHRAFGSRAKLVYASVYKLPEALGPADIVTYCANLVHLQNPFLALQQGVSRARETVIVTEIVWPRQWTSYLMSFVLAPRAIFFPDYRRVKPWDSWWFLPPRVVKEFLGVLGFEDTRVSHHVQRFYNRPCLAYTVVGRRTAGVVRA